METQHLNRIKEAREKYKPTKISCLFIAEAPSSDPDRFFYFEEVREQYSRYLQNHQKEIKKNGYVVMRGKSLIGYKLVYTKTFGNETDFVIKNSCQKYKPAKISCLFIPEAPDYLTGTITSINCHQNINQWQN